MSHVDPYLDGPILRGLLKLAFPIVLANLLKTGYQITDAFWRGRLRCRRCRGRIGKLPRNVFDDCDRRGFGYGRRNAHSPVCRHQKPGNGRPSRGANDVDGDRRFGHPGIDWSHLGAVHTKARRSAPEVYAQALGFMRVSFVGLIFVFAFAMFQALMRGVGQAVIPLYIVLGTVILNFASPCGADSVVVGWQGQQTVRRAGTGSRSA